MTAIANPAPFQFITTAKVIPHLTMLIAWIERRVFIVHFLQCGVKQGVIRPADRGSQISGLRIFTYQTIRKNEILIPIEIHSTYFSVRIVWDGSSRRGSHQSRSKTRSASTAGSTFE